MQEHHVGVELHLAHALQVVLYVKVVAPLEQDRRVVNKHTVQQGVDAHLVLGNGRLYFVAEVVVNGVLHVVGFEVLLETLLVDLVVFKDFHHDVETPRLLIGVKSKFEHSTTLFLVASDLIVLVSQDKVKNFLNQTETRVENTVAELGAAEHASLHLLQLNVLESENLLGIVVSDRSTLHLSNFHLHDVFEEPSTNQVVKFALKRTTLALELNNIVV